MIHRLSSNSLRQQEELSQATTPIARWTALMACVLLSSTWPLWLGQAEFPQIPIASWLCTTPVWVDWIGLCGLFVGLAGVLFGSPRWTPWGWLTVLICGATLVALDQHRLQPWFYQLLFWAMILPLSQRPRTYQLLMAIVVSIYFYSALGKFDFEFLHTVGQQFWRGLMKLAGVEQAPGAQTPIIWIATLPVAEMLLAVGLAFRPTRAAAGVVAIAFHGSLMLLLGPFGLKHSWGVFWWNFQFAGQAWLLFVWPAWRRRAANIVEPTSVSQLAPEGPTAGCSVPIASGRQRWGNRLATAIATLVIVLPAVERFGYWDHWTSWALYAPHSSRVEVWLAGTAVARLPPALQQLLPADAHEALWVRLPIEQWSLAETGSPIYPQARFQMGVAQALARQVDSEFLIQAILRGVAARWDGRRSSREFDGSSAIERAARTMFWLNTLPRERSGSRQEVRQVGIPAKFGAAEVLDEFRCAANFKWHEDHRSC